MVAVATAIIHEQNFEAERQLEILVGWDKIVRINIDGVCALRVRLKKGCELAFESPTLRTGDIYD